MIIHSDGIELKSNFSSGGRIIAQQNFEDYLPNGTYTISCCVESVSGYWHFGTTRNSDQFSVGINIDTFVVDDNNKCNRVYIWKSSGNADDNIKIKWIKLELGSVATPFVPPDPASELLKCQRYYYEMSQSYELPNCGPYGTTSYRRGNIIFHTTMRSIPTITFDSNDSSVAVGNISTNGILLYTNNATEWSTITKVIADAEIY